LEIFDLIEIPADDFLELKIMLERLIDDFITVENQFSKKILIGSSEGKVELLLRSEIYCTDEDKKYLTLVIAVISFEQERSGLGTKTVEWLKRYAISKNFDRLTIENANNEASIEFAKHLGFTNVLFSQHLKELLGKSESPDYEIFLSLKDSI